MNPADIFLIIFILMFLVAGYFGYVLCKELGESSVDELENLKVDKLEKIRKKNMQKEQFSKLFSKLLVLGAVCNIGVYFIRPKLENVFLILVICMILGAIYIGYILCKELC